MPSTDELWALGALVLFVVVLAIPAWEVGRRRGLAAPALAFIPAVGPHTVILASIGTSMWWAVVVLIPYIGAIALGVWLAFVVPTRHGRSRWWTVPLLIPILNLVAFFAYAFTLQRVPSDQALDTNVIHADGRRPPIDSRLTVGGRFRRGAHDPDK